MKNGPSVSYNQDKKELEYICTANRGRSEPSRIIAQEYLIKIGRDNEYIAISSGSGVDDIAAGKLSPGFQQGILEKAVKRGLFDQAGNAALKPILGYSKDEITEKYQNDLVVKGIIDHYFGIAQEVFKTQEDEDRLEALVQRGLDDQIKETPEQTKGRENVIAVFPMAKRNLEAVKKIYEEAGIDPLIMESLKAYVTGNQDDEVPNAFGEEKKVYHEMIKELEELVPQSVDKAIEEHEAQESLEEHLEDIAEEAESSE
tara:strand:+ start:861 stop:1634 length:774 start_codon:yes stop_codon:yes gene_type:complete